MQSFSTKWGLCSLVVFGNHSQLSESPDAQHPRPYFAAPDAYGQCGPRVAVRHLLLFVYAVSVRRGAGAGPIQCTSVAALIAPGMILAILVAAGWRQAFGAVGSLGFVWVALWLYSTGRLELCTVWSGWGSGHVGSRPDNPTNRQFHDPHGESRGRDSGIRDCRMGCQPPASRTGARGEGLAHRRCAVRVQAF